VAAPLILIALRLLQGFALGGEWAGSALVVNVAGVVGGAVPPLIAGTLQATYGSTAIGGMLAAFALISTVCTYLLPETNGTTLRSTSGWLTDPLVERGI
jgi:MFS family permease